MNVCVYKYINLILRHLGPLYTLVAYAANKHVFLNKGRGPCLVWLQDRLHVNERYGITLDVHGGFVFKLDALAP
jgi:hypothetical protein